MGWLDIPASYIVLPLWPLCLCSPIVKGWGSILWSGILLLTNRICLQLHLILWPHVLKWTIIETKLQKYFGRSFLLNAVSRTADNSDWFKQIILSQGLFNVCCDLKLIDMKLWEIWITTLVYSRMESYRRIGKRLNVQSKNNNKNNLASGTDFTMESANQVTEGI